MGSRPKTAPAVWVTSFLFLAAGLRPQALAQQSSEDVLDAELLRQLGIQPAARALGSKASRSVQRDASGSAGREAIGVAEVLNAMGPLSAALMTSVGGRDTQFSEVTLVADWDGREDCAADRAAKVDDFSGLEPEVDFTLTRVAISEHTFANGFTENVFYYGDSVGNVYVGVDQTGDGLVELVHTIHLPTVLNAFGSLLSDDQVIVTGLAVNPVADLSSFANVNGSYASFAGQVGEILYVTYLDTRGLRLSSNNTITRGGLLALPVADVVSPAPAPPGIVSPLGFPVTVGAAFGVAFTVFSPFGGLAVDDDGSAYFAQADLIQRSGANIVKVASVDSAAYQDRSLAVNGILTITTLNPAGGQYGSTSGPVDQVNRFTNYSGTSTLFGNVVALSAGACNTLYAAVAKSNTGGGDASEGLFPAPAVFPAGTPSMVISFADCLGAFDACSGLPGVGIAGQIPIGDGRADLAAPGEALVAGVNNFRAYVLGNGPDLRPIAPAASAVFGNTDETLKLDLQIDFTIHAGLALNEADKLFVIAGGTPAGIGTNPSPLVTEILWFEDRCPADRRGDFVDFRGNALPLPPASGGNVGDGDSDRFDHILVQAPIDGVTFTPTGLSGLARGFLLYLNRYRNDAADLDLANLPNGATQGDDATNGPIAFEAFDPSHSVAGGDDQNTPFRGDDSDGAGGIPLVGPLNGGFEFAFGGPVGVAACVWNELYLNSNGSVSFGAGDTDNTATILELRAGAPKIAPAWSDLNPAARAGGALNTFPVQALGFADVNAFRVRWINVPEFSKEQCGSSNTCALTLLDDGAAIDENSNQPLNPANPIGNNAVPFDLQEGPTDLVWERDPYTNVLLGCTRRREGSGQFCFDYCRMDLLGTPASPVLTGYSIGGLAQTTPPGLCEINVSEAARAADLDPFGVLQSTTASILACLIGEGTEPTLYEYFNEGQDPALGVWGEFLPALVDFDLRAEGNDALQCKPVSQLDPNRARACFLGVGCAPPANPSCTQVLPVLPVEVAPNQPPIGPGIKGIVNALCEQEIDILGCGFYPNEVTTICVDGHSERPGKVVSTAVTLSCDTNGDGIADSVHALANVTPLSDNHIRATLPVLPTLPGTAFGLACCGGPGVVTVTTTFTAGDNNVFGPFTRTTVCSVDLGVRAPVVLSVSPSGGDCAIPQDVLISGSCFIVPQGPVSRVYAVEFDPDTQTLDHANTIDATNFVVLNPNLIDALFSFSGGETFMIFVVGPGGTSRNLTQGETPLGCVSGNEQGVQVTFTCESANREPVAYCRNVYKTANQYGTAAVSAGEVNNGSFDPDGDPITLGLSPAGPYPTGQTVVTLTVTDSHGASDSCQATITVNAPKPKVRILAPDAWASEPGSNKGKFRVVRGGSTAAPLTVHYTVGGSATSGSDYFALSGSVTIPAGQGYADIWVTAKNDLADEAVETVIATLSPNAAYQIVAPNQAGVNIQDND